MNLEITTQLQRRRNSFPFDETEINNRHEISIDTYRCNCQDFIQPYAVLYIILLLARHPLSVETLNAKVKYWRGYAIDYSLKVTQNMAKFTEDIFKYVVMTAEFD